MPKSSRNYLKHTEKVRIPPILWKYCGEQSIPILTSLQLKITRPNEFNDPFEYSPGMGRAIGKAELARIYDTPEIVRRLDLPPLSEFESNADGQATISDWIGGMNTAVRDLFKCQLDEISAKYGVCCLSADPASNLMWAHYAQKHKGFVIGIDHSCIADMPLLPVIYSDRRVLFNGFTAFLEKPNTRTWEVLLRKGVEWSYEEEFRMIWTLDKLMPSEINGELWYMMPLVPQMISEIIIGIRGTPQLEEKLRLIAKSLGGKTKLKRAEMHRTRYKIVFREISLD